MMFPASARPKFKLRPPKLLVYYSLCLTISFVILLGIAQLRAVELAPKQQKSSRSSTSASSATTNITQLDPFAFNQTNYIYNDNSLTGRGQSIDRDDRANTYDDEPTNELSVSRGPEINAAVAQQDLAASPSNTAAHHHHPRVGQSAAKPEEPNYPPPDASRLAELTAAGTAAGLMIHDMMAQANMVNQYPNYIGAQQVDDSGGGDDDDSPQGQLTQQVLVQAGQQYQGEGSLPLQTRQVEAAAAAAPEPPSEDQMPDSIESLMGADGDAGEEDVGGQAQRQRQEQAGLDEGAEDELPGGGLLPQQAMNQQQSVLAANEADEGDDDDDENDVVALQQAGSHLYGRNGLVPVLMSSPRYDPPGMSAAGFGGGEQEASLVAPMRDSLVDLNAAAGHYYGKKKVKKVKKKKKIIIKKKKKKKKKYKKVKIIKITKKKKKKVKKKPKKHHHAHHHDHGKYYMYAKVPKKKSWEFGFKKGNKKHWIERHEKGHKNKFKTKVKWYDKKSKGKGVHIWDYNHHDKKKKKHY